MSVNQSQASISPPTEDSLETIIARVNFFESSVEQIRREFPKYLQQVSELDKSHATLSKVLRSVGAAESNQVLQYLAFLYADQEDILTREQVRYRAKMDEVVRRLDDWNKLLISPIREVIAEHTSIIKKHEKDTKQSPPDYLHVDPSNVNSALTSTQANAHKPVYLLQAEHKTLLPVHMKFFERYRAQEMRRLMKDMVLQEVRYHGKALEAYSQVLEAICEAQEREKESQT
eukprot:gene39311-47848_t